MLIKLARRGATHCPRADRAPLSRSAEQTPARCAIRRGPASSPCVTASSPSVFSDGASGTGRAALAPAGLNNAGIVGATYYGVSYLPAWLTHGIGHVGTWIAYHLMNEGRRGLLENLAVMFPELQRSPTPVPRAPDVPQLRT